MESNEKIQQASKELLEKAACKKVGEKENETKERMKKIVLRRDSAIKAIEEYQDQTGIPSDDEIDSNFISDIDVSLEEFKETESNEE